MGSRRLHRWLGLWVGIWLVWVGATGSLLALAPYVEGFQPSGPGRQLALQGLEVRRVDLGRVDRYHLADGVILVVDPPTGQVLARQRQGQTFKAWVLYLHELGGKLITGLLAVGCGFLLLTGWRLQPPTRKRVLQRPSGTYAWHRWLGWLVTPGLSLSLLTGLILVNYGRLEHLLGKTDHPPVTPTPPDVTRPVDNLLADAQKAVPGAEPTRLQWPTKKSPAFVVRMHQPSEWNPIGRTFVHLHPQTGEVLLLENPLQDPPAVRLLQGAFTIHAGLYPGGFGLVAMGLAPALMWTTGLILKSRRKSRQAIKV